MLKRTIRKIILRKRNNYTLEQLQNKSVQIKNILFENFNFNNLKNIHVFLPILEKKEIDTYHIINHIHDCYPNIDIIVPKIKFDNNGLIKGIFDNYIYRKNTLLQKNKYSIPEPVNSKLYDNKCGVIDMVIIPLLGIDKNGHRVGYGGGFYDRFLAVDGFRSIKVGLCIEPFLKITDIELTDVKLDYCILPNKNNQLYLYKF